MNPLIVRQIEMEREFELERKIEQEIETRTEEYFIKKLEKLEIDIEHMSIDETYAREAFKKLNKTYLDDITLTENLGNLFQVQPSLLNSWFKELYNKWS